jgi:hypothetical protein
MSYESLYNQCNRSVILNNSKLFFNTETHYLKDTGNKILKFLNRYNIEVPNMKISNHEIVFLWYNNDNEENINITIREENVFNIKIDTENRYLFQKNVNIDNIQNLKLFNVLKIGNK